MMIIETKYFTRSILDLLRDDEYAKLQQALCRNPELGEKLGHGLWKARWKRKGQGKRGGIRIIYYWTPDKEDIIYMLIAYSKNKQDNLTASQMKILKDLVDTELKNELNSYYK
jgi:hypothetical protein